jgi:hypothetical protein
MSNTNVDHLRNSRKNPLVPFTSYLAIRGSSNRVSNAPVLVFEGMQCPQFYLAMLCKVYASIENQQIIAHGKETVLGVHKLIRTNPQTCNDDVLFFVDRDYDRSPEPGSFRDIYVTPGYSIENEIIDCNVVKTFIRANFNVDDCLDREALENIVNNFKRLWTSYCIASVDLHKLIFLCRRFEIPLQLPNKIDNILEIDIEQLEVRHLFDSIEALASFLNVDDHKFNCALADAALIGEFNELDPATRWRGKYHLEIVKRYLGYLADNRRRGLPPFSRNSNIVLDPDHSGLLAALVGCRGPMQCLNHFFANALREQH